MPGKNHAGTRIALVPRLEGLGGPSSFNRKLTAGLASRGIQVTNDLDDPQAKVVLVNGGTRQLDKLRRARRRGARIVQRLDGLNWVQRKRWRGLRFFLRAEINNWILATVRRGIAHEIVYQSEFSHAWWERVYGPIGVPAGVIYNAVDLNEFRPNEVDPSPRERVRLLAVEGHWGGGNDLALSNTLIFARALAAKLVQPLELLVVGDVPEDLKKRWHSEANLQVTWQGIVPLASIPEIDSSADLFFSAELMAPCPNAVIEAMACGTPVLAYDTGSLTELVRDGAGAVVPYGADPWALETARPEPLVQAALDLLDRLPQVKRDARQRAEQAFGLDQMVDAYCRVLFDED